MRKTFFFLFFILVVLPSAALCRGEKGVEILHITPMLSTETIRPGQNLAFELKFELKENWHINSHNPNGKYLIPSRLKLADNNFFSLESIRYPEPSEYEFDFAEKPVSVFEDSFFVTGSIRARKDIEPGTYELPLEFNYQACRQDTCLKPKTAALTIKVEVTSPFSYSGPTDFADKNVKSINPFAADSRSGNEYFASIESSGLWLGLILVFLGGLALNLTPCVYPIIPITISYFGAQSEGRTGRLFLLGLLYVAGMATTYSVIGVVTALTGAVFGSLLQHPLVLICIAAFFVLMALSMFGLYELKLPQHWTDAAGGARSGLLGAVVMGLTMGIIAAPCIGPLVLGLVAYVAARADPVHGFFLFFSLSLGLGTPYLFLALFSGKIKNLPGSGQWMDGVRHIFGFVLLGAALYFAAPLLPEPAGTHALPVFGILAAAFLLLFDRNAKGVRWFQIFKLALCVLLIGLSMYALFPDEQKRPAGEEFSRSAYARALEKNRKMVIVFHADWCIPCRELEKQTLSDPLVAEKLKGFRVFEVDMTHAADKEIRRIQSKFGVKGVPTVILIDSKGEIVDQITGMTGTETFMKALSKVK
ncbi:MAG: thioredoxin family protein [Desulfobacteraceae bacterium]|nr:thioredoxin family protein [Desulfobacteraceae bacterium]